MSPFSLTHINFARYTSVKIGATLEVHVIHKPMMLNNKHIIGHGYNLLVSPRATNLAVLGDEFKTLEIMPNGLLRAGAALNSHQLYHYAKKHNLCGFEFLSHLPGSVGGLIKMNAGMSHKGMRYEIKDILAGITTATHVFIEADKLELGYRTSNINEMIYYAFFHMRQGFREHLLKIFADIRRKQPKGASFGSIFKNPPNDFAGRLIEAVGLKNQGIGGVYFSDIHANFLINKGNACFDDAKKLLNLAKQRVFNEFGILLEEEVVIFE